MEALLNVFTYYIIIMYIFLSSIFCEILRWT